MLYRFSGAFGRIIEGFEKFQLGLTGFLQLFLGARFGCPKCSGEGTKSESLILAPPGVGFFRYM